MSLTDSLTVDWGSSTAPIEVDLTISLDEESVEALVDAFDQGNQ